MVIQKEKLIRSLLLCALCWFLLNFTQLFFFGLVPVYSLHPIPWSRYFIYLTGVPWVLTFFRNFPFSLITLLITAIGCYFWFRKSNIITGMSLAICGAFWQIGPDFFKRGIAWLYISVALAVGAALIAAWLLQRVWDNWDAPAPATEEKKERALAWRKKWPIRKRLALLLVPVFLYCGSSSLCALGGTYRTVVAKMAGTNVMWKEFGGGYYKSGGDHIWYFNHVPTANDCTMSGLVKYAWLNGEFGPALFGSIPHSFSSFVYDIMDMKRFGFITVFLMLYLFWFMRPSWLLYVILTTLFLTGVAIAKNDLVWQFTQPLKDAPWLVKSVPDFLYFWATKLPI